MREGWEYKKLGEVCDIRGGSTPLRTNDAFWVNGNVPWFTIDDIREQGKYITYTNQKITEAAQEKLFTFPKGTVMLCCTASLGACSIAKIELTSNQQFNGLMIKNKAELLEEYLYYYSSTLTPILNSLSGKATINFVSRAKVEKIEIPIPPLFTQQQIVAELDLLSHILDQKRKQLREYDDLAESIFYDMFGNPVENPKGWELKPLKSMCVLITDGSHFSPKEVENGLYPMLSVKDMKEGSFSYDDCKYIDEESYSILLKQGCKPLLNDVLVAKDGSYFKTAFVIKKEIEQAVLSSIAILRPNLSIIIPTFLQELLVNKNVKDIVARNFVTGTAIRRVILKKLGTLELPLPPLTLQQSFASKIEAIEQQKQMLKESIKETETLFQSRMDYWFNNIE